MNTNKGSNNGIQQEKKKRVLSGMQPTGALHLGHYLGVLKNFVALQKQYDCYFMIANWHSLTVFYPDYASAHKCIAPIVSDWIAAGIDPEQATIFVQSDVPYHAELSLILSMFTPVSWLTRNPTYKEKLDNIQKDIDSHGFLGYPVLQAADILLYQGEVVPIGDDQLPHLELSREIARRFNFITKSETFIEPEALLSKYPKVLGTDGRKMSKSYNNTIGLAEDEATIREKIKTMKTDVNRVRRNDPGNPDECPVHSYFEYFLPERKAEIDKECRSAGIGCIDCKKIIADKIVTETLPFRETRARMHANHGYMNDILHTGSQKAIANARITMESVKGIMGLTPDYRI